MPPFFLLFKKYELALLVASSFLIAIWPMRDTIAARNILLIVCTLISIFYLCKNFTFLFWRQRQSIKNWMPIILVASLFIWVLIHYFSFSHDPVAQFKELKSTWARSFMAGIIGFTVGLIINRREKGYEFIMCSLILGFLIVLYQYSVRIFGGGSLYQEMWWSSIYWGKINEVLYGSLFIAGAFGNLLSSRTTSVEIAKKNKYYLKFYIYTSGLLIVLHCYVFQIKAMSGVGIAVALLIVYVAHNLINLKRSNFFSISIGSKNFITILLIFIITSFSFLQVKNDPRSLTFVEDIGIAFHVDKYSNWQTAPSAPLFTDSGRKISPSVYERSSWVIIGSKLICQYPLGYGLVHNSFRHLAKFEYPQSDLTLSHSGWLDFGLSFGIIGLGLSLISLIWTFCLSIISESKISNMAYWFSLGVFFVYGLVEIFFYHGVEILFFWLVLLPASLIPISRDPN